MTGTANLALLNEVLSIDIFRAAVINEAGPETPQDSAVLGTAVGESGGYVM